MVTEQQISDLESTLEDIWGEVNASTWLQLVHARPWSDDPARHPHLNPSLVTDLHDEIASEGDEAHWVADILLELARYPTLVWVPTCTNVRRSTGSGTSSVESMSVERWSPPAE